MAVMKRRLIPGIFFAIANVALLLVSVYLVDSGAWSTVTGLLVLTVGSLVLTIVWATQLETKWLKKYKLGSKPFIGVVLSFLVPATLFVLFFMMTFRLSV